MTAEVLDYRIKQINHITGINILDDKSFDEALYELIKMYSNLKREKFLKETECKNINSFEKEIKKSDLSVDLDKILGMTPDYERYPGCGYDRSWCG